MLLSGFLVQKLDFHALTAVKQQTAIRQAQDLLPQALMHRVDIPT